MSMWFLCAAAWAGPITSWTFDEDDGGFSADTRLQWQWGTEETGLTGWSTRLDGLYLNDATDHLLFPDVDLDGASRPVLGIHHSYDIDTSGDGDGGWLEAFVEGEWQVLEPFFDYPTPQGFSGDSEGENVHWFDLSSLETSPALRLVFRSDSAIRRTGWFIDKISVEDGDPVPPRFIGVSELSETDDVVGPYPVTATVLDDQSVENVEIHWETNGGSSGSEVMVRGTDGEFVGAIAGQDPGTVVEWWVEATDGINVSTWPPTGENRFTVSLPAPFGLYTDPENPSGRIATTEIDLRWSAPTSRYPILRYQVERDGIRISSPSEEQETITLVDGTQQLTVRALFNTEAGTFTGDASESLPLHVSLPAVTELTPDDAWPGDRLRVELVGANLYMDATTTIDAGNGIEVDAFEIIDAHSARALLHVTPEAEPGLRVFNLHIGETTISAEPVFQIRSEGDRPIVLGAHPTSVRQGAHTTVFIDMSAPIDASLPAPIVNMGEGIIVETVNRRSTGLDITLSVAHDAPLGAHIIEVDEGDRLITGASLEVRDTPKVPDRNCTTAATTPDSNWIWFAPFIVWARRRTGE
jgi:hypothetical protein